MQSFTSLPPQVQGSSEEPGYMYLDYFSLQRHPFRITPDPSLFFPGGTHGRGVVLDALVYGITSGEGILKVVGEVGSGKTMLCRMLEERLPKSIEIVYLANPSLTARDIVYAIAIELRLDVDAATDRLLVLHKLQAYLLDKHAKGGSVVVFIEEAQSMPLETLEEVRLLSNLETHRHKLMQIVLFGQPELDRKLEQKSIRQLRERITHSFYLDPLRTDEIREYLHFRLQSAGCPWPHLFSSRAEQMLAKASAGLTRRINILADKALLASYADPATRPQPRNGAGEVQPMVLPRHVKIAIADSDYRSYRGSNGLPGWLGHAGAALAGALLVAAAYWFWSDREQASDTQIPVANSAEPFATAPVTAVTSSAGPEPAQPPQPQSASMARTGVEQPRPVYEHEQLVVAVSEPVQEEPIPETDLVEEAANEAVVEVVVEAVVETEEIVSEPEPESDTELLIETVLAPEPERPASTSQRYASLDGLLKSRIDASISWLESLPGKNGYTVQLYAVPTSNTALLQEYLEFLLLTELLDDTYVCLISGNPARPEQWLVLHGEFAGLSEIRRLIENLPPYIGQHGPYARNLSGVACANERI